MNRLNSQKWAFFRQSGWMMITTTAGGMFMLAANLLALKLLIAPGSYGAFTTLLGALNLMLIPSAALQLVFTQQTAAAQSPQQQGQLSQSVRAMMLGTFILWAIVTAVIWVNREALIETFKLTSWSLLVTLLTCLPMLWQPIVQGLLQGSQNFLWLGWAAIFNGAGRFICVFVFLRFLHWHTAGAIAGAFVGMFAASVVGFIQTKAIRAFPRVSIDLKPWLTRILPLTLGLGAAQFMFSFDMIPVRKYFTATDSGLYGAAGTIARGLVTFTGPIATVMFPKIVRNAVRGEKSNVFVQTVILTAGLAVAAALFCTLFATLLFRLLNKPEYFAIAPLVPWFAWCMAPLTVANVLLSSLLARSKFSVVPWLITAAAAYWYTLERVILKYRGGAPLIALERVVQTIGLFSLLFLTVTLIFSWLAGREFIRVRGSGPPCSYPHRPSDRDNGRNRSRK